MNRSILKNYVHLNVQLDVFNMLTTTLSDFRRDIKHYLEKVTKSFETLIINRGKDSGIVIMSLEEYNSLKATHHELLSSLATARVESFNGNSAAVYQAPFH